MIRHSKLTVATLALFLSAFFSASAATTPPKVVFIGDWITYYWDSGFAANANWVNKGSPGISIFGNGNSYAVLARFQTDVVNLHPAIVHIMVGEGDATVPGDSSFEYIIPGVLTDIDAMVKEAKAANIKVILGIEPTNLGVWNQINSVIASYGALNNIPVINYGDALCGCVGSVAQSASIGNDTYNQYGGGQFLIPPPNPLPFPNNYPLVISPAGYSMMTQMAQNAIAAMNLALTTGWLQNIEQSNDDDNGLTPNVKTVQPASVVQFTPVGYYSDGSQHSLLNTNFEGSSGAWTSSNPLVMYISQSGLAWANSQGTAIIRYTSPGGVKFPEWIMYVNPPFE